MLWTIIVILLILWLLGAIGPSLDARVPDLGGIIHVLIVLVVILLILRLLGFV